MQIIIIGGGLTGLVTAYKLCQNSSNKILIFEKGSAPGGMLASYNTNGFFIEKYYHHIFKEDKETIGLMRELGIIKSLKWHKANNGYFIEGKSYPLNTPFEFLKLPEFSIVDLAKLGLLLGKIKLTSDLKDLDNISAKDWIIKNGNRNIWQSIISPLLESKFGNNAPDISAAWFVKRIKIRSNRRYSGEILGYLDGGFETLLNALLDKLKKNRANIFFDSAIVKILVENGHAKSVVLASGKTIHADRIIFTASEMSLQKILPEKLGFPEIKYQGTVCALLSLNQPLTKNTYWLNIRDKEIPFRALIEHTNFISKKKYNGEHLVYLTYYFQDVSDKIATMKNTEIIDCYFEKLKRMFPHFNKSNVNWWKIEKEFPTAPVYEIKYLEKILPYRLPVKNLFIGGINSLSSYPERSINASILTATELAKAISQS